jgi:putative alpha-1,2-mannosidase
MSHIAIILLIFTAARGAQNFQDSNAKYVNPLIGTAGVESIGGAGGTVPSTSVPFAMTKWTAMTQENWVGGCPYIYWQTTFYGFLASHQPAKWMVSS